MPSTCTVAAISLQRMACSFLATAATVAFVSAPGSRPSVPSVAANDFLRVEDSVGEDGDTTPHATPGGPAGQVSATPQSVYHWDTDHCPGIRGNWETRNIPGTHTATLCSNDVEIGCDPDVTDAPMKAFRAADGTVRLLGPVDLGSRAMVGQSLSALSHSCAVYMNSTLDYNMSMSANREWAQSPFIFPENNTVYALTHMEYHNESNWVGLWSSVTLMRSTDGGLTWDHARPPPRHIVAASPYVYQPTGPQSVLFGFRSPSNIIQSRDDGFYYAFIMAGWIAPVDAVGQRRGECLLRTHDVSDPSSWRAWDGKNFSVRLGVNPYLEMLDPSAHICEVVTNMTYISLLWSSFYGRYMAVGTYHGNDRLGVAFQLADDLADPTGWSEQTLIDTAGFIDIMHGNGTERNASAPVPGLFARPIFSNGTYGSAIWWLSPGNRSKHPVHSCDLCGIAVCSTEYLHNVPAAAVDAIAEGSTFDCHWIGGGATGFGDYIYPSLIDETSTDPNFNTVGEMASLFYVTDNCEQILNTTGQMRCSPWDPDGIVHRDVIKMPVRFTR